MLREQRRILRRRVLPALVESDIRIMSYDSLSTDEQRHLDEYFTKHIFGLLTPRAVDAAHPFPFIPNLSLPRYDGRTRAGTRHHAVADGRGGTRFAHIEIPDMLPPARSRRGEGQRFVLVEELIQAIFTRFSRVCASARATRFASRAMQMSPFAKIKRLTCSDSWRSPYANAPLRDARPPRSLEDYAREIVEHLIGALGLTEEDVYRIRGLLNVTDLMSLYNTEAPELKDAPLEAIIPIGARYRRIGFRSNQAAGHTAASSLHRIYDRHGFHARGGGRPRCCRHQDVPLPHRSRLADHAGTY
jgi:polyphosphate kinase